MDPYRNPYGHNLQGYLNEEIFNYGQPSYDQPMHHLMNQQEIPVRDYDCMDDYPSPINQQMHQMYYDNNQYGNQYGNRGYQSHNHPYAPERIPYEVNPHIEYSSQEISVDIRLSSSVYINRDLINELYRQENLTCEVRGNVITVTGLPLSTRNGAREFLATVKKISGDRRASIVG